MERGSRFHRFRKHAKTSSALSIPEVGNSSDTTSPNSNANDGDNNNNNNKTEQAQQDDAREQDQYMPIANVIRIMRRILPAHAKISDDAKETIQECVSEFISFVTGEANERCQREQRKTITAEDVLWAMGKLGFDDYVEPLSLYLGRYRENENDRSSLRGESIAKRGMDYGPIGMAGMAGMVGMPGVMPGFGAYAPMFPMGNQQGLFDAAAMGGYYKDESSAGGSSSQTAMANFDPFAQFK